MLITIKVPENTVRLFFSVVEDGYEREFVPVTMGMIVNVATDEIGGIIEPTGIGEKEE